MGCSLASLALFYHLLEHGVEVGEADFTTKQLLAFDCSLVAFINNVMINTLVS